MLTAGYAAYRAWRALGGPCAAGSWAGHSLGEYTALVRGRRTGVRRWPAARCGFRAQAMQEAVPAGQGAMAAILNLEDEKVREACASAGGTVQAVNFNAPGQNRDRGRGPARGRACDGSLQSAGRETRAAAPGQRAVPFDADEARR